MTTTFDTVADLLSCPPGTALGHGSWRVVEQPRIDTFADATDDHQWIHVDAGRAAAGPYGTTIAHGMLTLSLVPIMIGELAAVPGASLGVNYGFDKVRFTHPVPVGSRIRADVTVLAVSSVPGGAKATFKAVVEIEGVDKPACIAEQTIVWME
ncbi:MaoC family dehydratase [Pseudonocardia pini]|uniref:MaoC family dehydratase n=1 Tax=Pseudonocardia pini TaxID=2758030 RepID=UPI0015EFFB9E|nr:MaoC family dehydratase [Pseudonocardia pini]